jgi:hypothetical protein
MGLDHLRALEPPDRRPRASRAGRYPIVSDYTLRIYAKPAIGGASAVLCHLGRYTHRVAISNHGKLAFDGERQRRWTFSDASSSTSSRAASSGSVSLGFSQTPVAPPAWPSHEPSSPRRRPPRTVTTDTAPRTTWACPHCGAAMIVGPILSALQLVTVTWTPHDCPRHASRPVASNVAEAEARGWPPPRSWSRSP